MKTRPVINHKPEEETAVLWRLLELQRTPPQDRDERLSEMIHEEIQRISARSCGGRTVRTSWARCFAM